MGAKVYDEWITNEGYRAVMYAYLRGYLNGYIELPKTHPLHGVDCGYLDPDEYDSLSEYQRFLMDELKGIDVHGGITFSGTFKDDSDKWYVGFDTTHYGDGMNLDFSKEAFKEEWNTQYEAQWQIHKNIGDHGMGIWRDPEYVRAECEKLSKQLFEIEKELK